MWNDLGRYFPDDGNGSRILVTSRNKDAIPDDSIIHVLPSLSNDQCWELLKMKVFDQKPCPPELIRIGKKIATNCRGLPHAVVTAGILASTENEETTWEDVGRDLASHIFYDGNNSVMERSFQHLPEYLWPCLLYFGVFSENEHINVRELLRFWIAEGFLGKNQEKNADIVAEEYLMELIDRNLVMVGERRSDVGSKLVLFMIYYVPCACRYVKEKGFKCLRIVGKFSPNNICTTSLSHFISCYIPLPLMLCIMLLNRDELRVAGVAAAYSLSS